MLITKEDLKTMDLPEQFLGASLVFRYQKTGGTIICPTCKRVLGVPKQQRGTVVNRGNTSICPNCASIGRLKYAQINTKPGSITRAILKTEDGTVFSGKTTLHKDDTFDKATARHYATQNLIKKIRAQIPVTA